MDVISQHKIREFLLQYNQTFGTTILLTSHYMEDIQALCKRVIIINQGRKVYDGQLAQIVHDFSAFKELTITFSEPVSRIELSQVADIQDFDPLKVTFRVKREELMRVIGQLLADFKVDDINTSEVEISAIIAHFFRQSEEKPA